MLSRITCSLIFDSRVGFNNVLLIIIDYQPISAIIYRSAIEPIKAHPDLIFISTMLKSDGLSQDIYILLPYKLDSIGTNCFILP
jgi:hypothetical protein